MNSLFKQTSVAGGSLEKVRYLVLNKAKGLGKFNEMFSLKQYPHYGHKMYNNQPTA